MTAGSVRTGVAAAARCLALDQHAATVLTGLAGLDIPAVLLKGPGLAQRFYANAPERRRYSDVDILVAPADFDRAETLLAALGHVDSTAAFPRDEWLWHERHWIHPAAGDLNVDLHRSFSGVADAQGFWDTVSATSVPLDLCGVTVQVPGLVASAMLVGLHAAAPGQTTKPVTDLVAALGQVPDAVWEEAGRLARCVGAEAAFVAGLRRVPAGVVVADRLSPQLGLGSTRGWISRLDLVLLARSLDALRTVPGVRAKVRFARRRMFPSAAFLASHHPLAAKGPAGLTLAYLLRPLRLLRPARNETSAHERLAAAVRSRRSGGGSSRR